MKAAGVLPFFRGIAVHDAWKPYDSYGSVAGHALCNSHLLRELIAVTETGIALDRAWAQQAIDALLALKDAAGAAREAGRTAVDPRARAVHEDWLRKAAVTGIALNAGRKGKLQEKRHALATRMQVREDDYLRFARDLRVPFDNGEFCAIRSYLATAARHGTSALDALTRAFQGNPWIPETG
jgi:transposase